MAPHAALAEIGVAYELVEIDRETAQTDATYRSLNPLGVVPTLVDGDTVVSESAAILLYLADRYPEARLAPEERAQLYRWLVFMTNTMQTTMLRLFYPERYGDGGVAAHMEITRGEAEGLRQAIMRKLGLQTATDLMRYARENGFTFGSPATLAASRTGASAH